MLIDTHAHLYVEQFEDDLSEVVLRAKAKGVDKVLLPNIDLETIPKMHQIVKQYPDFLFPMMGLHPCSVGENYKEDLNQMYKLLDNDSYIAIGEIGVDLYWDKTFKEQQFDAFVIQAKWAAELDIPIVIHSRESIPEILDILEEQSIEGLRGVFHCFTGNIHDLSRIEELGFYVGIGGILTFKNGGIDKILDKISLDRILFETDAPYLAPTPYRGKRNESSYLELITQKAAEILDIPYEEMCNISYRNTIQLFDKLKKN